MPPQRDPVADPPDPPEGTDGALYFLGLLDTEERAAFQRRLTTEPAVRDGLERWSRRLAPMHDAMPAASPPPSVWAAIQRRVQGDGAPSRISARRPAEGVWLQLLPGVRMRLLHVEPVSGARSAIMRMDPGAEVPAHDHPEVEECFVLDGIVAIDDGEYGAGDHLVAPMGTSHQRIVARSATTLLLHWGAAA